MVEFTPFVVLITGNRIGFSPQFRNRLKPQIVTGDLGGRYNVIEYVRIEANASIKNLVI